MKFDLSDFVQLDTKGLLAVNGGYNCNGSSNTTVYSNPYYSGYTGGGGHGGGGSGSGNGNGGGGCGKTTTPSADDDTGSGKGNQNDNNSDSKQTPTVEYRADGTKITIYPDGSRDYDYPDGGHQHYPAGDSKSTLTDTSSSSTNPDNDSNGENTHANTDLGVGSGGGVCSGGSSSSGTHTTTVTSGPSVGGGSSTGGSTGDPTSTSPGGGTDPTQDLNALIQERLFRAIKKVGPHSYDVADDTYPNEYRCDEYVADILERSGFNVYDYCVDDPVGKSVDTHYQDMLDKNLEMITSRNDLEKGASYILVMRDKDGILDSHVGLYINGGENGYCFVDNSSSNYGGLGGTETHIGGNISEVLADYHNYEYMYFVKLQ